MTAADLEAMRAEFPTLIRSYGDACRNVRSGAGDEYTRLRIAIDKVLAAAILGAGTTPIPGAPLADVLPSVRSIMDRVNDLGFATSNWHTTKEGSVAQASASRSCERALEDISAMVEKLHRAAVQQRPGDPNG